MSEFIPYAHRSLLALLCCVAALPLARAADTPPVTDPTRPPHNLAAVKAGSAHDSLLLVATHVSPTRKRAVINDKVVTVGSHIAGALVTEIGQGRVSLRRGSESIVLQLLPPPLKRPAKDPT